VLGKVWGRLLGIISLAILSSIPSRTQESWSWPAKPSNLQVLPKEWPGSKLRPLMTGFTRALGVRCPYCHKGEEGKPLSTYDFASDENPNKNRAREMVKMLSSINDHLKNIQPSGDKRINVRCETCHRGRPRPMTLSEELGEQYRMKGLQPALDRYAELKTKYYGRGAYDFGEAALNDLGCQVLENKDAAGAIQVFKLNAKQFPQSGNVWSSLAEADVKAGDLKMAKKNYEKALKLDRGDENSKEMLKKIKESNGQ
jgi:tetratricopeptide (TPR) repeat protein